MTYCHANKKTQEKAQNVENDMHVKAYETKMHATKHEKWKMKCKLQTH